MQKNILISLVFSLVFSFIFTSFFVGRSQTQQIAVDNTVKIDTSLLATQQEAEIVASVAQANEAVVSIVITKDVPKIETYYEEFNPFDSFFFDDFFGGGFSVPRYRENGTEEREVGGGSGFIVSSDGFVVTNKHVVDDEDADYTVFLNDESRYEAKIIAKDPTMDIAILQLQNVDTELPFLEFADSDLIQPGQVAIAIGNALAEFRNSVAVGVVSGLSRSIVAGDGFGNSELLEEVIQTDAAINPGNSGGPLLNSSGKVIGVNVAVASGSQNIGFALPSRFVKDVFDSVQEFGEIVRPFLGIRYNQITQSMIEKNDLPVDYGVIILRGETVNDLAVIPGSPADKAGIQENDIILEIGGIALDGDRSFGNILRDYKPGDIVVLKVLSKGEEKILEITLEKFEE